MRVQSDSPTGVNSTRTIPSDPSPSNLHHLRDHLWPQPPDDLILHEIAEEYHPTIEHGHVAHLNPHFPLQVDPSLQGDVDPALDHSFGINPARSVKKRGGTSTRNRIRMDLLSPNAAALFQAATAQEKREDPSPASPSSPTSPSSIPRLPPILQVEKKTVTTTATQQASASRRRNEAHYQCPVPGCGSTFTRRFNLRGHLRSHTEERPFVCEWPGCNKGFARQHDCKRHFALHVPRTIHTHTCGGCGKSFSRTDALNRHLRSENAADCREKVKMISVNNPEGLQHDLDPNDGNPGVHPHSPPSEGEGPNSSRVKRPNQK